MNFRLREAPIFYSLYTALIVVGAGVVLIPNFPLVRMILLSQVLNGALLPVVSYIGPTFALILTGTVVVETIFTIPGMGRYYVLAAFNRDYTLILGDVIVVSVLMLIMNFFVDILYGYLDPRISYK